jgi:hypothetical protein
MGDIPNETVVWVDVCPQPGGGLFIVEYDPVGLAVIITPVGQGEGAASHRLRARPAAPTAAETAEALEQKDEWESVDAPTSPLVTHQSAPGIPAPQALG